MTDANLLGDYLRARRELVQPASVGLPVNGLRRVAGLRREEVAMLAGVSADDYLRLEQGRDRNPSPQVLEALARVLGLDDSATDYLLGLTAARPTHRRRRPRRETVPPGILHLLEVLSLPAFVEGRYLDVLAVNSLATALSPNLQAGRNRIRDVFLNEAEQAMYPDWASATAGIVAGFRRIIGTDADDPRFVQLVGELSLSSERFRQLWARHDIKTPEGGVVRLLHPQIGELSLRKEKLTIDAADLTLVIYHAQPGTDSDEKLGLLASLARPPAAPARTS